MPATGGEIRTNWTDDCGNMWLFGTTYVIPFQGTQCYNNLWRYNPNTGLWAWLYGDTAVYPVPDFGVRGVSSPTNVPAATMGTISFNTDTAFWILGGMETLPSNYRHGALWKYIPDQVTADFIADTVCWGDTTTFTNLSVPNCNMIKGYYWTFGDPASGALNTSTDTIPTHVFTGAGTFNVKLVVQSCTFSWDSITLPVNVTLSSLVSAWGDTTIIAGDTVQLYAGSGTGYQWTPSAGLDCDTCQNPIANPTQNTTYQVTYTDSLGCIGTDNVTILIIQTHPPDTLPPPETPSTGPCYLYVPNIFSPNGDGNNDVLYVRAPGYTLKTFVIYDRWGGKVFSTTDVSQGWDGTYRGKKVNTGVYVYYLKAICISTGEEEVLKGNVSVVQ